MSESSASRTKSPKPQPPTTIPNKSELGTSFLAIMGGAGVTALGVVTAPVGVGIAAVGVGYAAKSYYDRKTERDKNFNKLMPKATSDAAELFKTQRELQGKLQSSKNADERKGLRDQIDKVQQAHIDFTTWLADNDLDLPLPDQDTMNEKEYQKTQANWRKLCAGDGQISIPKDASKEFKAEMRAMNASLLSSKSGRSLLDQILNPQKSMAPIRIAETPPDAAKTREDRVKRLLDRDRLFAEKQDELHKLREQSAAVSSKRGPLAGEIADVKRQQQKAEKTKDKKQMADSEAKLKDLRKQIQPYDDQMADLDKQIIALETEQGEAGKWEPPPPGLADPTGQRLTMRQGLRDSEFICYGEKNEGILTPAFLVYAHELVHCARRRAGIARKTDLGTSGLEIEWNNLEEYGTIHGDDDANKMLGGLCENQLRDDYKLPPRKYVRSKTQDQVEMEEAKAL
jgi:prefoldin subunit 5